MSVTPHCFMTLIPGELGLIQLQLSSVLLIRLCRGKVADSAGSRINFLQDILVSFFTS